MGKYAGVLMAAALLVCGNAIAQAPQTPAQAPAAGSAGEAAGPVGGLAPGTGSFQNQPVTQKVDITDAMMLSADRSDDWILHGRTYDNQRFTPFTQVNAGNVRQLRPTAIIQTGITKTFQMTAIEVDGVLYLETADNHIQA
jgi:glucose dehydrogenase